MSETSNTSTGVKTATAVKRLDGTGIGYIFKVEPPMTGYAWGEDEETPTFEYVWVHGANVMFSGPETYIFGCTVEGSQVALRQDHIDYSELPGSYKGSIDHTEALQGAGYDVVWGEVR